VSDETETASVDAPGRGAPFVLDPRLSLGYRLVRRVIWVLMRIWFRPVVEGPGRIPAEGPVLIAPVHRSNLDFGFSIFLSDRKLFFMAKDTLWRSRLLARFVMKMGAFPVHRESADRSALKHAESVLAAGETLVLFPEGTRQEGPHVGQILEGAAFLSARTGAVIIPVGIGGSARAMPKGSRFPRPVKIRLYLGPVIEPPAKSENGRVPRSAVHRHSDEVRAGIQDAYDRASI